MGILSILAWHFSVGRMCKPISPPCFNIWQIVVDRLAARDMLLYAHTSNQSPLFRYLANRGGQACSKRGASVCSNATVPRMIQYLSTPRCFFQRFHGDQRNTVCQKHQNTISAPTTPKETKLHSTMMCNNNNNNNVLDNDRQPTRGRTPLPSACPCRRKRKQRNQIAVF